MNAVNEFDQCPHCRHGFEIVCVKFGAFGTRLVLHCPNCAFAPTEQPKRGAVAMLNFGKLAGMMTALNARFRTIVMLSFAAVVTAALLRHGIHIYGGVTPTDIRIGSLFGIPALGLVVLLLGVRRTR